MVTHPLTKEEKEDLDNWYEMRQAKFFAALEDPCSPESLEEANHAAQFEAQFADWEAERDYWHLAYSAY